MGMKIWKFGAPIVAAGVLLPAALGLTGCSSQNDDSQSAQYARVCIDQQTQERVQGDQCGSDDSRASDGFLWWYLVYGHTLPAYGYPVVGGVSRVTRYAVVEHDERLAPKGGKAYTKATTRSYSTGNGKSLGVTKGGSGYKGPAVRPPAPKAPAPAAPKPASGGGYKAPSGGGYKPAPVAPRPVAPAPARPIAPPVRFK